MLFKTSCKKGLKWHLVHGDEVCDFNSVLDRVMLESSEMAIGMVYCQAEIFSLEFENKLWNDSILGEDTPDKLRSTVLYLLGVNCALRASDKHYNLHGPRGCTTFQLSFKPNSLNVKCLVYCKDNVTKCNKGGVKKERKIVWIKPSNNVNTCPIRLVRKYLTLLPKEGSKPNLYLQSMSKPRLHCWYPMSVIF